MDTPLKRTGTVSEICVGTLAYSHNQYLDYPCTVVVHVMERDIFGAINMCTVAEKSGVFVTAHGAVFADITKPLPLKYQKIPIETFGRVIRQYERHGAFMDQSSLTTLEIHDPNIMT